MEFQNGWQNFCDPGLSMLHTLFPFEPSTFPLHPHPHGSHVSTLVSIPRYSVFGDTVVIAYSMETTCFPNTIQVGLNSNSKPSLAAWINTIICRRNVQSNPPLPSPPPSPPIRSAARSWSCWTMARSCLCRTGEGTAVSGPPHLGLNCPHLNCPHLFELDACQDACVKNRIGHPAGGTKV